MATMSEGKPRPTATSTSVGGSLPLSRSGSLDRRIFLIRHPHEPGKHRGPVDKLSRVGPDPQQIM